MLNVCPGHSRSYCCDIEGTAPVEKFVFLEKEGNTYVHTTVMADCTATVKRDFHPTATFVSKGCNLVEAKE